MDLVIKIKNILKLYSPLLFFTSWEVDRAGVVFATRQKRDVGIHKGKMTCFELLSTAQSSRNG